MNCQRIQELLLTDYADGEASAALQEEIRGHLASCPACRDLEAASRRLTIQPFEQARRADVPAGLWAKIKTEIEPQIEPRQERSIEMPLLEKIRRLVVTPRPAFAFSTVAVLLVMALAATQLHKQNDIRLARLALDDQANYLAARNRQEAPDSFGTDIERYFL